MSNWPTREADIDRWEKNYWGVRPDRGETQSIVQELKGLREALERIRAAVGTSTEAWLIADAALNMKKEKH